MQHKGRIRVEICWLSNALVVKILVTLLGIVPRSFVTTARNRVISSLLVPFDLKGSRVLLIISTGASSSTALLVASSVVLIPVPTTLVNPNTLTPEMVQQMIISAFFAFGLSGNYTISSKP